MRLRFRDQKPPSRLEAKFALFWQSLGGPALEREFRFHAERKWRADFAHVESRTLNEGEGSLCIKGGGRHNRAAGFIADAEKYLEAALADWRVLRLTELQITAPMIERIIAFSGTAGVKSGSSDDPTLPLFKPGFGRVSARPNPVCAPYLKHIVSAFLERIRSRERREKVESAKIVSS